MWRSSRFSTLWVLVILTGLIGPGFANDRRSDNHESDRHERNQTKVSGSIRWLNPWTKTFVVEGRLVKVGDSTNILDTNQNEIRFRDLSHGDRVEVSGIRGAWGAIHAREVLQTGKPHHQPGDDDDDDDYDQGEWGCHEKKLEGFISEIDPASGTLVVGVVLIRTDDETQIDLLDREDKSQSHSGSLEDLQVGDYVRVDYCANREGPPLASRIREKSGEHHYAHVDGKISEIDVDLAQMMVNSVLVLTTEETEYRSVHHGHIEFEDLAVGDYVKVFGRPVTGPAVSAFGPVTGPVINAIKVHRKRSSEECQSMLRGMVNEVDVDSGTLTVGIVEVHTLSVTKILDASGEPILLADLVPGDFVKVSYCTLLGVPIAAKIQIVPEDDMDLNDDGEVEHRDLLDLLRERCDGGVLLDFDGDNRTTGRDFFRFMSRWRGRGRH
ncbi:MAG: hypothetical protein KC917_17100 [Candidatus Omnitrophica bacterium]|nr:hypothetical protein [Candidatus Omnitrophota bacterium]